MSKKKVQAAVQWRRSRANLSIKDRKSTDLQEEQY